MQDKQEIGLKVGDFVSMNERHIAGVGTFNRGVIAAIGMTVGTIQDVLVVGDSQGVAVLLPSAYSTLSKTTLPENEQRVLNKMKDMLIDMQGSMVGV